MNILNNMLINNFEHLTEQFLLEISHRMISVYMRFFKIFDQTDLTTRQNVRFMIARGIFIWWKLIWNFSISISTLIFFAIFLNIQCSICLTVFNPIKSDLVKTLSCSSGSYFQSKLLSKSD